MGRCTSVLASAGWSIHGSASACLRIVLEATREAMGKASECHAFYFPDERSFADLRGWVQGLHTLAHCFTPTSLMQAACIRNGLYIIKT